MTHAIAAAAVLVVVALASGCAPSTGKQIYDALKPPPHNLCLDGWPARLLQDPSCYLGICGYTCAPRRWQDVS